MAAANLTAARVRELLSYDPLTGDLTWRVDRNSVIKAGDVAGAINSAGYVVIRVDRQLAYAHRLAWLHVTGDWPAHVIDHDDGQRSNNRWKNLKARTQRRNCLNQHVPQGSSKQLGANKNSRGQNFRAIITIDHKQWHIGTYRTAEAASEARALVAQAVLGDPDGQSLGYMPALIFAVRALTASVPRGGAQRRALETEKPRW